MNNKYKPIFNIGCNDTVFGVRYRFKKFILKVLN